jgi:hypothetical protein
MALVYSDGKVDENNIDQLNILSKNISDSYAAGKISNDQYTNLKNEVSTAFQEFFKKKIDFVTDPNMEAVNKIKNGIEDAYNNGKLTREHYTILKTKYPILIKKSSRKELNPSPTQIWKLSTA